MDKEREVDPIKQYEADKKILINQLNNYKKSNNEAIKKFNETKQKYGSGSEECTQAYIELEKWRYCINQANLALKFIRPNNSDDIEYRNYQYNEFVTNLQSVTSRILDLRYHGTPIYNAEQIIKSKSITPTPDRYNGYTKSTNASGEISATTIDTLYRTINFHSDIKAYERSLPCGCIFALFPRGIKDYQFQDVIRAVDFKQNPEQLFGIITSPENNDLVKGWMQEANLNPGQVYTFEEFINLVQEKSMVLEAGLVHRVSAATKKVDDFGKEEMKKIAKERDTESLVQTQKALKGALVEENDKSRGENRKNGETRDL